MRNSKKAPSSEAKLRDDLMSSITYLRREVDVRIGELTERQNHVGERMEEVMNRIGAIIAPDITEMAAYENLVARVTRIERVNNAAAFNTLFERVNRLEELSLRQEKSQPVIIRGGWINVYATTSDGTIDLSSCQGPFPDREAAEVWASAGRIACIKMPDFHQDGGKS